MFCNKCGTQVPDGASNCTNCGAPTGIKPVGASTTIGGFDNPFANGLNKETLLKTSNSVNLIGLVAAVIGFIAAFLPGIKISAMGYSETISVISSEFAGGWLIFVFMLGLGAAYFLKMELLALCIGALNFIFALYLFFRTLSVINDYGMGSFIKMGFGIIIYLIVAIILVAAPFIWKKIKIN